MSHAIVYFDGVCNFCNGFVNFLIRNDKKDYFRYSPLQSEAGQRFLKKNNLSNQTTETFYLVEHGRIYSRSTAALKLLRNLGWKFSWAYLFIVIPEKIRDVIIYNPVSRNRYKWFGRKDQCMIPTKEMLNKFILN